VVGGFQGAKAPQPRLYQYAGASPLVWPLQALKVMAVTKSESRPLAHSPTRPLAHVLACGRMGEQPELPVQPSTTRPRAHDGADIDDYTLDVTAAAALLGRSENTVRRLIREGELPAWQVHGPQTLEYRLRKADVLDVRQRRSTKAPTHPLTHAPTHAPTHPLVHEHERVGASDAGASQPAASPVSAAAAGVAGVQALIEQATAPLVEANRHLQEANERLSAQLVSQAEELGRLRERLAAAEVVDEAGAVGKQLSTPLGTAQGSHDRGALWDELAAHVRPAPSRPQPEPQPPPRRSLIHRLLRR